MEHPVLERTYFKMDKDKKSYDKNVSKVVNKSQLCVLSVSFREQQMFLNGESQIVEFVSKCNLKEVTLDALFTKIQEIEQNKEEDLKYGMAVPICFPIFPIKFKSSKWDWKTARTEMSNIMKVLGFRRGNASVKTYSFPEHQPEGWPEAVSFKKPKFATKNEANLVIESILLHHGVDPYKNHASSAEEDDHVEVNPRRSDRPVKSRETVDDDSDSDQYEDDIRPGSEDPADNNVSSAADSPVMPSTSASTTPEPGTSSTTPTSSLSSVINGRGSVPTQTSDSDSDSESSCPSLDDESEAEDIRNNNTIDDDEEDEEESGNAYEELRKRNMEERQQLWKELVQEKEAASSEFSKPKKKKQKIYPQPTKVTSQYSLRQARRKNPKYAD